MLVMASIEEVLKLARLARLSVEPAAQEKLAHEFEGLVAYIGQLDALSIDTKSAPRVPVVHNRFRTDEALHLPGAMTKAITAQFPQREGDSLSVKKILSHD